MWTLFILVLVNGSFSSKLNSHNFEFSNEKMCEIARVKIEKAIDSPKNVAITCFQTK